MRFFRKKFWRSVYGTHLEEVYKKKRQLLDEAGIDYRVWMDENNANLVFYREYFEDPVKYRRHYDFYVRVRDYKKACDVLHIDNNSKYRGSITSIFLL